MEGQQLPGSWFSLQDSNRERTELAQEWEEVAELNQLEQFLRQPDAVMEPSIVEKLRQYVAKKGNPKDAVEMLTDNYIGSFAGNRTVCSELAWHQT